VNVDITLLELSFLGEESSQLMALLCLASNVDTMSARHINYSLEDNHHYYPNTRIIRGESIPTR